MHLNLPASRQSRNEDKNGSVDVHEGDKGHASYALKGKCRM